jgi:hypothetical protein
MESPPRTLDTAEAVWVDCVAWVRLGVTKVTVAVSSADPNLTSPRRFDQL